MAVRLGRGDGARGVVRGAGRAVAGAAAAGGALAAAAARPRSPDRGRPVQIAVRGDRRLPARRGRVQRAARARRAPPRTSRRPSCTWSSGSASCRPASCSGTCSGRSTRGARSAAPWPGWRARPPAPTCRRRWPIRSGSGNWPAAAGILAFAALELVASDGDKPENLAIATLVYSAATFVGMALYGVEPWTRRAEAFSVYYNLFSRLSPFDDARRRGGRAPLPLRAAVAQADGRHRAAARGDDRLGHLRRRLRGRAVDEHRARHGQLLRRPRAVARATRSSSPS